MLGPFGSGVLLSLSLCFKLFDKLVSEDAEEFHDLFASGLFQFPNIPDFVIVSPKNLRQRV